jgi:hypothetical protein
MAQGSPVIDQTRMRLAEYDRQDWVANIQFGVTIEDIQTPGYWAHLASQLKPYDHIEARAEDGSWIAYLVVTGCDRAWAKVAVDRVIKLTTADVALSQEPQHKVEWKGPQYRFSVIRLSDSEKIKDGFMTKDEAHAWMVEHERVVT